MHITLVVSSHDLRRISLALNEASVDLARTEKLRNEYRGVSGSPQVDDAVAKYFRKWSDGMHKISKGCDALSQQVGNAVDAYDQTERANATGIAQAAK